MGFTRVKGVAAGARAAEPPLPDGARYDPMRPNNYAEVQEQRAQQREREERAAWERKEAERVAAVQKAKKELLEADADEAFRRRVEMSKGTHAAEEAEAALREEQAAAEKLAAERNRKQSVAEKIMRKQGWQRGQALGRGDNGLVAPLEVIQTSRASGVVRTDSGAGVGTEAGQPSRVILLRNLVSAGEADATLRSEVAEQCARYGEVSKVQIFEEANRELPPEEQVRVFVRFERIAEAMKAVVALDRRKFAGRVVSACFFSEARFGLSDFAANGTDPPLPPSARSRRR